MAADSAIRRKAAFTLAKALANPKVRDFFLRNGYNSDQEIIIALESDTIEDVLHKVCKNPPPVTVAIYWPQPGRLEYTSFAPGEESPSCSPEEIGGGATIGMLSERIAQENRRTLHFKLAWNTRVGMQVAHYENALA